MASAHRKKGRGSRASPPRGSLGHWKIGLALLVVAWGVGWFAWQQRKAPAHYTPRPRADGTRRTLLLIPEWDFNWQSDFRFARPVYLPKGSELGLHFTYDNSTSNARNPHHPPRARPVRPANHQ